MSKAPILSPMTLSLAMAVPAQTAAMDYLSAKKEIATRQRDIEERRAQNKVQGQSAGKMAEPGAAANFAFDKSLNDLAKDSQVLDLTAGERITREGGAKLTMPNQEGLAVTYTIANKTTLPSRSDRQLVQIAAIPVKAEFAKIATPVLTGYVYDEAKATNASTMVLLAGPVTAYSDGSFVGSGELPTVAIGESFTAGLGIDSGLRSGKELVERTETIQGGNRVVELTYRLTVENFGATPATVRLMDRLPKVQGTGQGDDIRVTLVSSGADMSAAEDYVKTQKKDGILRWDVQVPPQAVGAQAFGVEYKFRLEYDKQMSLVGLGG